MALWSDEDVELKVEKAARSGEGATRLLAILAILLVLALAAGSVYGLVTGTRQKKLAREADNAQSAAGRSDGGLGNSKAAAFTGIGTIRAKSADDKPAVVVATIAFPYDAGDGPFAEELGRKAPVLKAAALTLLSTKKAADLGPAFEGALKAALRDAFNARLSLGKVTEIWLSDFAVIQ